MSVNEKDAAVAVMEDGSDKSGRNEAQKTESSLSLDSDEPTPKLHAKTFLAVVAVCMIYFAQLVNLVGAGAQGQTIAGHFNGTADVVWFSSPITILTVVLGPIVSQAADYWGRKWFLVILTLIGAAGCVIVARATTMNMAIAGFTVIGISYGTQPLLHAVTSEVLPRRWRAYGQAADMVSNGLGAITGLLVGGALNRTNDPTSDGFRYYYYMTMGWFLLSAILTAVVYNPPQTELMRSLTNKEKLAKLDWVGYFLLAAGLVLFSLGLSWSENPYPWSDPHVSATFSVGLATAIGLVVYETWFKKDGMFHHGLFTGNRNFAIALFCIFAEGVAFFAANTYFAFQISVLYETDALLVTTRYSMSLIATMALAVVTGWYCARTRKARWLTVAAFVIFVVFFVCMATTDRTTDEPTWGYTALLGSALGMTLTTLITLAQLSTPPELIAVASGLVISIRSLGGTIGLAIYNALFNNQMNNAGDNIAKAAIAAGLDPEVVGMLIGGIAGHNDTLIAETPGVTPEIIGAGVDAFLDTFVLAFRNVWIAGGCFVALAAIVACFLFDPKKEFNMHIDAPMEKEEELYSA